MKDMMIGLGTDFWSSALFSLPTQTLWVESEYIPQGVKMIPVFSGAFGAWSAYCINLSEAHLEFQYLSSPEILENKVSENIDTDYNNLSISQIYLNFDDFINEQKKITKILINEK